MRGFTCWLIRRRFSACWDGTLPETVQRTLQAHLDTCPACAREWHLFQATQRALQALPRLEPPADFVSRVAAQLPAMGAWRWAWWGWRVGLAAGLVGLLVLALWWPRPFYFPSETAINAPLLPPAAVARVEPYLQGEARLATDEGTRGQGGQEQEAVKAGDLSDRRRRTGERRLKGRSPVFCLPSPPTPTQPANQLTKPTRSGKPALSHLSRWERVAVCLAAGRWGEAEQLLAAVAPSSPEARTASHFYLKLAAAYRQAYRLREAMAAVEAAQWLDPAARPEEELAEVLLADAQALWAEGDYQAAARECQWVLANYGDSPTHGGTAASLLAQCQAAAGERELEEAALKELVLQWPNRKETAEALLTFAQRAEKEGRTDEALETYQTLLAQFADEQTLVQQGLAWERTAVLLAARSAPAETIARCYREAQTHLRRAVSEQPDSPAVRSGLVLLKLGQVQEALADTRGAIETYVRVLDTAAEPEVARLAEERLEGLI